MAMSLESRSILRRLGEYAEAAATAAANAEYASAVRPVDAQIFAYQAGTSLVEAAKAAASCDFLSEGVAQAIERLAAAETSSEAAAIIAAANDAPMTGPESALLRRLERVHLFVRLAWRAARAAR